MSLRWDNHFLHLCLDHARMSKDPSTKIGAVIVGPDREIRSAGFNGFPRGIADDLCRLQNRETKLQLMVHGEMNAILAAARVGIPLKDCTMYIAAMSGTVDSVWGGPPCIRCTVEIIPAGITRIISRPFKNVPSRWKQDLQLSRFFLTEAGIEYLEVATDQNI